jgi:hypothetical protein
VKKKAGRPRDPERGCFDSHAFLDNGRCRNCERKRAKAYRERQKKNAASNHHKKDAARQRAMRGAGGPRAAIARAQAILFTYVNRGKIARPTTCEACPSPHPLAYHPDPAAPLDVEWLCRACRAMRIAQIESDAIADRRARVLQRSEEEEAARIAQANLARRSGEEIYDALPADQRAAIDTLHRAGDREAIQMQLGTHATAIMEYLDRRANHQRLREMMRRHMGSG